MGIKASKEKRIKRLENQVRKFKDNSKIVAKLENNIRTIKSQK